LLDVIRGAASEIITKVDSQILEITEEVTQNKAAKTQGFSDKSEQPAQSKFFGNTPYKDILEKAYFNVSTAVAPKIIAELESHGLKFSGMNNDNNMTTFTLKKTDSALFKAVVAAVRTAESELKVADKFPEKIVLTFGT